MTRLVPFAKASDLQTLVPVDDDLAALAVRVASSGIRRAVGWDVDLSPGTYSKLYTVPGHSMRGVERPARPQVVLPCMALTGVQSVVVDGTVLTAEQWDATLSGIVHLNGVRPTRKVTVAYTAGYRRQPEDEAPGVFEEVCLEHAVSLAANPENLKSYTLLGANESFSDRVLLVDDTRLDPWRVNL